MYIFFGLISIFDIINYFDHIREEWEEYERLKNKEYHFDDI